MFKPFLKLFIAFVLLSDISNLLAKEVNIKTINVDVATDYGILVTEIHYDERQRNEALEIRDVVKNDLIKVVNYFKYVPKDIVHININPYEKISNGNAVTFPTNIINLYSLAPSNDSHLMGIENWMQGVLVHEFIHITHLDKTRGIWNVGRKVFGTIAKIPTGVVPSWFTEGVATWGESYLIKGGRLNHPTFNLETLNYFLRSDKCETIDCLDMPKGYPGRSLSYWAGSHFLEYLENKKPETVYCLVHKNSSQLPFLLNGVFEECTGKSAQENFKDFKQHLIDNMPPVTVEFESWGEIIKNSFGHDNLQKGVVFDGSQLFKVEVDRYHEALVSYDREDNIPMVTKKFPFPIGEITEVLKKENDKFLIASFYDDPFFRENSKNWYILDAITLEIDQKLPFSYDPQYVRHIGNNLFLLASHDNGKWSIRLSRLSDNFKNEVSHVLLTTLDQSFHLKRLDIRKNKAVLVYNQFESNLVSELDLDKIRDLKFENNLLYKTHNILSPIMIEEDGVIFKDGSEYYFLDNSKEENDLYLLKQKELSAISRIYAANDRVVISSNRIKSSKFPKEELFKKIKESAEFKEKLVSKGNLIGLPAPYMLNQKEHSYPRLDHFIPHYWFLTATTNENVSSIGLQTSFNDPMFYTKADVNVLTFPSISKAGGNFDLTHKFQSPTDLLGIKLYLEQDYFKSNVINTINKTQEMTLRLFYTILDQRWTHTPSIGFGYEKKSDFVSDVNQKRQSIAIDSRYKAQMFHSTWQSFGFFADVQRHDLEDKEDFYSIKSKVNSLWRISNRLVGGIKLSYGKQFKTDFSRGVIFGGGSSDYLNERFFEFYGIPYGDVYGNEIGTLRFVLDYNLLDIYRGKNLFPFYLKEIHLLLGREFLMADRILVEEKALLKDKVVSSIFAGPRLSGELFYYIPFELDLIFSHIRQSIIGTSSNVEANLKISF